MIRRWRGILSRLARHAGKPLVLGGRRYKIRGYLASSLGLAPAHEPAVFLAMQRVLAERKGAFLDIGMNNGQTLLKLLRIDPDRTYVGFEPQLLCCASVNSFIEENGLREKSVLPVALSDENGVKLLRYRRLSDESATLEEAVLPAAPGSAFVPTARGDDLLQQMNILDIALIKVDVEGHEQEVLAGLSATLATTACPVLLEVIPNFAGPEGAIRREYQPLLRRRAEALYRLLTDAGYSIFSIDDEGRERPVAHFIMDDPVDYPGHDYLARKDISPVPAGPSGQ